MHNRPVLFNCYPDFCVGLSCLMTTEALKPDVHIHGDEFVDFKNLAIIYWVYFLLMSANLNAGFLSTLSSKSKETILLQIEDGKPQVFTLKLLWSSEITIQEAIALEDASSASHDKSRQMNDIEKVVEESDGIVLLRLRSFCEPTNLLGTSPSRKSFFDFHSSRGILEKTKKPQNYLFRSPIAEPVINDSLCPSSLGIWCGYNVLTNPNCTID